MDLIDTLWNVKQHPLFAAYGLHVRFNRYIVECKVKKRAARTALSV